MQQVSDDQPPRRDLHPGLGKLRGDDEDREAGADEEQAQAELRRTRRLARAEPDPDPREDGRERDDEERLQRLEIAARKFPAENRRPRGAIGEQIQRRTCLLELGPEDRRGDEEDGDGVQAAALGRVPVAGQEQPAEENDDDQQQAVAGGVGNLLGGDGHGARVHPHRERRDGGERDAADDPSARLQPRGVLGRLRWRRVQSRLAEILRAGDILNQPEHHADARGAEADVPVDALSEVAADERRDERAEVDAHVVDREAGVAPVVLRTIQRADDHGGVALEQAGADDDQRQPDVERRQRLDGHAEVSARDDDAAVEHGAPLADQPVRHPPARQAGHVDHRRVEPVHRAGDAGLEAQATGRDRRRHEEDEQRAHAVIAEALPHLGEEERRQPARVAEERAVVGVRGDGGNSHIPRRIQ